jgi:predicted membrane protein
MKAGRAIGILVALWFGTMAVAAAIAQQRKRTALPAPEPDADRIDLLAIFGPLDFRSTASAFQGGSVECWFGGGSIDLRDATLAPGGAYLRVTAVFGGGSILVPDEWDVEVHVVGIGGASDGRPSAGTAREPSAPTLVIEGVVAFGGFAVLSSDPRTEAVPAA